MQLDRKRILITGGGSGIGLELARRLAHGNEVVIAGRDGAKLERARTETPALRMLKLDVTSEEEAQRAVSWLASELGGLDLLVNNAGFLRGYSLSAPDAATKSVEDVEVNLGGSIRMTRLALPLLEASSEGAVLVVSSAVALAAVPGFAVYAATKAALHSLARSLRAELKPSGVRVFEVLPPVVDTGPVKGLDVRRSHPRSSSTPSSQASRATGRRSASGRSSNSHRSPGSRPAWPTGSSSVRFALRQGAEGDPRERDGMIAVERMRGGERSTQRHSWAAYAACAWALVFAVPSFYWAAGGRVETAAIAADIQASGLSNPTVLALAGALKVLAGLIALALVGRWGRAVLLRGSVWAAGAVFLVYALANFVDHGLMEAGVRSVPHALGERALRWHLLLWDPWWLLGGTLSSSLRRGRFLPAWRAARRGLASSTRASRARKAAPAFVADRRGGRKDRPPLVEGPSRSLAAGLLCLRAFVGPGLLGLAGVVAVIGFLVEHFGLSGVDLDVDHRAVGLRDLDAVDDVAVLVVELDLPGRAGNCGDRRAPCLRGTHGCLRPQRLRLRGS